MCAIGLSLLAARRIRRRLTKDSVEYLIPELLYHARCAREPQTVGKPDATDGMDR
jgi:hypothetical protein